MRFKPTFWPTLITIPMLTVLVGLGGWQLDRLEWKTARIDERKAHAASPPVTLPYDSNAADDDIFYRPARVTGHYIHDAEMYLLNRVRDGRPGVHVITPLIRRDNGAVLLVDRGWAPFDWPEIRANRAVAGTVEVTVTGIIRPENPRGWLTPDNRPRENQWYFIDLVAMAAKAGAQSTAGYYLFATAEATATPDAEVGGPDWPVANEWKIDLPNDHLSYAITWFALAVVLLLVYFAYHTRRNET